MAPGFRSGTVLLLMGCLATAGSTRAGAASEASPPPLPEPETRAWQTGVLGPDRLEHASLAFSSGLAIALVTRRPLVGFAGAISLGLAKELWDRRGGHFDGGDLIADAVGAGLGAIAASSLER